MFANIISRFTFINLFKNILPYIVFVDATDRRFTSKNKMQACLPVTVKSYHLRNFPSCLITLFTWLKDGG